MNKWHDIGLYPRSSKKKQKVANCPRCKELGKKHLKDPSVSINLSTGLYKCHKCGWAGKVKEDDFITEPTYQLPSKKNITNLSNEALKFFTDRDITQEVVKANRIAMTKEGKSIVFPYLRSGKLVNYKIRGIRRKDFRQSPNAESIMYNYDRIVFSKNVLICEGEIDAMSWEVAGVDWHTSVNQGAPNPTDTNVDKKLECITNCYEVFEQAETVYIGVDNDANGRRLQEELIRRIGAEKIKLIDYSPFKDANEFLIHKGAESLRSLIREATDPKIEGVFKAEDRWDHMQDTFKKGKHRGSPTYIEDIDKCWTWREGEVTVWTGYENEGKSTFLQQLALIKAVFEGWKFAFFAPEDAPVEDFFDNLIEMYIGKPADPYWGKAQMSFADYKEAFLFINQHFFLIYPERNYKLESILDRAKFLIRKYGVRAMIIDPYNSMEHLQKASEREELYVARFMGNLKRFATDHRLALQLVAHQNTQRKGEDGKYYKPNKANIKGGGVFAQRADNVNIVWRPNMAVSFKDKEVVFASQKIKKQKLVGIPGEVRGIIYDLKSNRYYFDKFSPLTHKDKERYGDAYTPPEIDFTDRYRDPSEPDLHHIDLSEIEDEVPF